MIYVKWLIFALSEKFMDVLNLFLAPVVVLFADADGWLPGWLSWFQTLDYSLDGDRLWQEGRRPFRNNTGIKRYINRIFWLYRNSMNGYAHSVVGIKHDSTCSLKKNFDWPDSGKPAGYDDTGGQVLCWRLYDGDSRCVGFQIFWMKYWSKNRAFRLNIGWKLWGWDNAKWDVYSCVLSVNPWKKREAR